MKPRGYFYCGLTTTYNILLNLFTGRRFLWLEGRVSKKGVFHNWAHRFRYKPEKYLLPKTEQEIIDAIRDSPSLRLFGAGHSFNVGVQSEHNLMSLDNYTGIIEEDLANMRLTVRAGTRVRDVIQLLLDRGLAFKALPSHNAQSIGGILSTDVHGTGRDWGWVSEMVMKIKVIDGNGDVHVVGPGDELFTAAIGGIGAIGIISEVTVQARKRFNVEQECVIDSWKNVKANLDALIEENEHMSLYVFPFTDRVQINKWNSTAQSQSFLGEWREWWNISNDALASAWFGNLLAYWGILRPLSKVIYWFKKHTNLVLESAEAYSRSIYHNHQELEFTVPYEDTVPMIEKLLKKFEEIYDTDHCLLPYTFIEVRFTPKGHELSMIGPGRDRRCAWMDFISNDTHGFEVFFAAGEDILREAGARPHMGKYCETVDKSHLHAVYGAHFDRFLELRDKHDPNRKFINPFTRRLFGD